MIYGYIRVSSASQNIDRQVDEITKYGVDKKHQYIDKQSGKDFNRAQYQKLIKKLKENDLLVIKSIDRLGRNYEMIIHEWSRITKDIKADILVLDMPLLDTRQRAENLVGKFTSDIVLQVLSFVAQNERESIRQRQAEGIRLAKARGVHMGRPPLPLPRHFHEVISQCLKKEITSKEAKRILNMTSGTFYRNLNIYKKSINFQSLNNSLTNKLCDN